MSKSSKGGHIVAFVFGLAFASAGIGLLVSSVIPTLWDWQGMLSFEPVSATLTNAELLTDYSSDGPSYKVTASYNYRYMDQLYSNDRVAINPASDNIGSFHENLGKKLKRAYLARQPIQIWLNPSAPEDSVINRDLRWGLVAFKLVFVILFCGIGLGVIYQLFVSDDADDSALVGKQDKPWLEEARWQNGLVRSEAKSSLRTLWFFAIAWNLLSSPIPFVLPEELASGNYPALIGLLFPLIGVGLFISAIVQTLRWRRFGASHFKMKTFPSRLGEQVAGFIEINHAFESDLEFDVSLACIYSYESGSGEDTSQKERVLWQDEKKVAASAGLQGTRVLIEFDIPPDLPASEKQSSNFYKWVLYVEAKMAGPDFKRQFIIPVFPLEEHSTSAPLSTKEQDAPVLPSPSRSLDEKEKAESLLGLVREERGSIWNYPAWRSPGLSVGLFLFGLLCCGSSWFIAALTLRSLEGDSLFEQIFSVSFNVIGILMSSVFTLVGIIMVLSGIYVGGNALSLMLNAGQVYYQRRLFGIPIANHTFPVEEIRHIDKKIIGSSSTGTRHKVNYEIRVHLRNGKHYTLAQKIHSASDADAVLAYFREELKL